MGGETGGITALRLFNLTKYRDRALGQQIHYQQVRPRRGANARVGMIQQFAKGRSPATSGIQGRSDFIRQKNYFIRAINIEQFVVKCGL